MILTKTYPSARSFNNVFDELFRTFPSNYAGVEKTAAPVNISESERGFDLDFNVPGRNKEDFKISVENGLLTVSYEKPEAKENDDVKSIRKEFSFASFKRSFNLDEKINAEGIAAKYENGILRISLPKKEEVKNAPKQISIQ